MDCCYDSLGLHTMVGFKAVLDTGWNQSWISQTQRHDWPDSSLTPDTMCRYDVCIQIPDNYSITSDISTQLLPAGFYATMRTIHEPGEKSFLKWKLFDLILATSPKFKQYQFESNMGPWYEISKPLISEEQAEIVLCSRLRPSTMALEY